MIYRTALFLLILLLWILSAVSTAQSGQKPLAELADSLLSQRSLRGSSWSIYIKSLRHDSVVYAHNEELLLIPASVTKLVTTTAALDILGPDYRFVTTGYSSAVPATDGTLHGDLYLRAGGDPSTDPRSVTALGTPLIDSWIDSIKTHGVRKITGDVVMQTWPYRLECAPSLWEVGDVNSNIAPVVDGFGFYSNVCQVAIYPGAEVDSPAVIVVTPPFAPLEVRSTMVTCDRSEEGWIDYHIVSGDTIVTLSGETPLGDDGQYLWVPIQDPARFLGNAVATCMDSNGIEVLGTVRVERGTHSTPQRTVFFSNASQPLSELIKVINKESDNYSAEYVLRAIAAHRGGPAEARSGLHEIEQFLHARNIGKDAIMTHDGCGLARQNLISAEGIVRLLSDTYHRPHFDVLLQSLALSGQDGTLASRLSSPLSVNRVFGKTGTMTGVSSLAGYVATQSGDTLAFGILCNNYVCSQRLVRAVQDQLVERALLDRAEDTGP